MCYKTEEMIMTTTNDILSGVVTVSAVNTLIKAAKIKKKRIIKKKKRIITRRKK